MNEGMIKDDGKEESRSRVISGFWLVLMPFTEVGGH